MARTNNDEQQIALNILLSTIEVVAANVKGRHWLVSGTHFRSLHLEFDDVWKTLLDAADKVAETQRVIGGVPYTSMTEFVEASVLVGGRPENTLWGRTDGRTYTQRTQRTHRTHSQRSTRGFFRPHYRERRTEHFECTPSSRPVPRRFPRKLDGGRMIYLVCMILLAMIVAPLAILVYILYRKVVKQREWNGYKKRNRW